MRKGCRIRGPEEWQGLRWPLTWSDRVYLSACLEAAGDSEITNDNTVLVWLQVVYTLALYEALRDPANWKPVRRLAA